jgi:hypothetical protein
MPSGCDLERNQDTASAGDLVDALAYRAELALRAASRRRSGADY